MSDAATDAITSVEASIEECVSELAAQHGRSPENPFTKVTIYSMDTSIPERYAHITLPAKQVEWRSGNNLDGMVTLNFPVAAKGLGEHTEAAAQAVRNGGYTQTPQGWLMVMDRIPLEKEHTAGHAPMGFTWLRSPIVQLD